MQYLLYKLLHFFRFVIVRNISKQFNIASFWKAALKKGTVTDSIKIEPIEANPKIIPEHPKTDIDRIFLEATNIG